MQLDELVNSVILHYFKSKRTNTLNNAESNASASERLCMWGIFSLLILGLNGWRKRQIKRQ